MRKLCVITILVSCWIECVALSGQEIDRLLAAVNGKVITELDLKTARMVNAVLELGRSEATQSQKDELDRLITQELISQEMENNPISQADQAQVDEAVQAHLDDLRNAYAEIGGLPALLRQLGLENAEDALKKRIHTLVLSEKFISLRFSPFVDVSAAEVEVYYREKLAPELKDKGLPIPPLAEKASAIEVLLKEEKKNSAWFQWLESVRSHSRIELFAKTASLSEKKRP
ncbi:MAG: hypothetical protein ABSH28_21515 [Acidobacteriota bacterium]|jgi:hypothetical protein